MKLPDPYSRNDRFRWASLQLNMLSKCPLQEIEQTLKELPEDLDGTYERILRNIDKKKQKFAHRILQCITVSFRPLHVKELAEVFAIEVDAEANKVPKFNARWRPKNAEDAVLSACSTLVSFVDNNGSKVVQFSHFSVKEYLTSSRLADSTLASHYHIRLHAAHTFLARACLCILLQLDYSIDENRIKDFPLVEYAARCWVRHAQFGNVSSLIRDEMDCLFDKGKPHFAAWIWAHDINIPWKLHMSSTHPEQPEATPLYYAALCGFRDIVEQLSSKHPKDAKARGGECATPLHAAVDKGHLEISLFLLQQGADVNARDKEAATPLHLASPHGDIKAMRLLIDHGANPNTRNKGQETPLVLASENGRLEATQLLLEHGADVNLRSESGWHGTSPLDRASTIGQSDIAQLLLDHGAKANEQGRDGWTSLHYASRGGHAEVARLLLDCGANVNAQTVDLYTPLHSATRNGYLQVVDLLLKHGADPHLRNQNGHTPFQMASEGGYHELAQLLSQHASEGI
jgi:ankyrin repeat protein